MIELPGGRRLTLRTAEVPRDSGAPLPRRCYAAPRVVVRDGYADVPHSTAAPGAPDELLDWADLDACDAQRARLDALGFGVAEAMDTSQRSETGWAVARELIERTGRAGLANGFVGAASADHAPGARTPVELADAIAWQCAFVAERGGVPIVLPQIALIERGASAEDYFDLYTRVADASPAPILLHWLGEAFHPGLAGYFPGDSVRRILAARPDSIRGIKMSLLDADAEVALRRELHPRGQVVLTGDDFSFAGLIEGEGAADGEGELGGRPLPTGPFSHALLGVLDAIARPAARALRLLGEGDADGYRALMRPCEALGRVVFEAPTRHYKAGLAFLAWLNGLQSNPMLPNHVEEERSMEHYARVAEAASEAGVLEDAALAVERLAAFAEARAERGDLAPAR